MYKSAAPSDPKWITYSAAIGIILLYICLALSSVLGDSTTMDEPEHLTAGYSYVKFLDARLNPWHPPLVKAIAALPLLAQKLSFPIDSPEWKERKRLAIIDLFFYQLGNDSDGMLRMARMALIACFAGCLWMFYRTVRSRYSTRAALLALSLLALSPTFLAHSRYVTTDVASGFGVFFAVFAFLRFIERRTWTSAISLGVILGLALLTKFSAAFIVPVLILFFIPALFLFGADRKGRMCGTFLLSLFVALAVLVSTYQLFMINMPVEVQKTYNGQIEEWKGNILAPAIFITQDKPILRAFSWYLTGMARIFGSFNEIPDRERYLEGETYRGERRHYYLLIWTLKESLSFLAVIILSVFGMLRYRQSGESPMSWMREHFAEALIIFSIVAFWIAASYASINIGIRHIFPTLPLLALSAAGALLVIRARLQPAFIAAIILLQGAIAAAAWPNYIGYFNVLSGDPDNASYWSVDSNLDWGQDLKRLRNFVQQHKIDSIYIKYWGASRTALYLSSQDHGWPPESYVPKPGDWFAVSIHPYRLAQAGAKKGTFHPDQYWSHWFDGLEPVGKIGSSTLIFRIPEAVNQAPKHSE